jgi:hypothetical protein
MHLQAAPRRSDTPGKSLVMLLLDWYSLSNTRRERDAASLEHSAYAPLGFGAERIGLAVHAQINLLCQQRRDFHSKPAV